MSAHLWFQNTDKLWLQEQPRIPHVGACPQAIQPRSMPHRLQADSHREQDHIQARNFSQPQPTPNPTTPQHPMWELARKRFSLNQSPIVCRQTPTENKTTFKPETFPNLNQLPTPQPHNTATPHVGACLQAIQPQSKPYRLQPDSHIEQSHLIGLNQEPPAYLFALSAHLLTTSKQHDEECIQTLRIRR